MSLVDDWAGKYIAFTDKSADVKIVGRLAKHTKIWPLKFELWIDPIDYKILLDKTASYFDDKYKILQTLQVYPLGDKNFLEEHQEDVEFYDSKQDFESKNGMQNLK